MHRPTKSGQREPELHLNTDYYCFSFSDACSVLLTDYENKDSFPTDLGYFFFLFIPQIPYFWVSGTHSTPGLLLNQHH